MDQGFLHLHNVTRWIVLLLLAWSLVRAARAYIRRDRDIAPKFLLPLVIALDFQLLIGIAVYLTSPMVRAFLENPGWAMGNQPIRYVGVEHPSLMLMSIILAHVTHVRIKRATDEDTRRRRALYGLVIVTILVAVAVPWSRPLFPGL